MHRLPPERNRSARRTAFAVIPLIAASLAALEAPPLKSLAPPGLRIGAALNQAQIDGTDAGSLAIVKQHFNSITSENILKWERRASRAGPLRLRGAGSLCGAR